MVIDTEKDMEATQNNASYTIGEAKKLRCAHCEEGFKLDNPKASNKSHAFITGGLIAAIGCEGEHLVYHGYLYNEENCFYQATKGDLFLQIDSDHRKKLDDQVTDLITKWFGQHGPKGCKLSKIRYNLDISYKIPDRIKEQLHGSETKEDNILRK